MENPNEYDDATFTRVSMQLQSELSPLLDEFWSTGASIVNVEEELASALDNTDFGAGRSFRVQIVAT